MDFLRLYLLAGLVFHKLVWEIMKRGAASRPRGPAAVRAVKLAILAGIVVQACIPDVLPIAGDPAALRIAGAAIYTAGLALAVAGRVQLGASWSDIEAAGVPANQVVVERGVYRYIRHPIYAGDLALLLGLELALNSWLVLGVVLLAPVVVRQALKEERLLAASLEGYPAYCTRTRRFVPFLW
jgi:protein-S-isoprenylcysteine O-methyltransferase Ste14